MPKKDWCTKMIKKMFKSIIKLTKKKEIRFLIVGVLNTIVGYALYALFLSMDFHYLLANTIATILAVIHSYLWHRFYTFRSNDKAVKEIIRFASVYLVSYIVGMITLTIFKQTLHINVYVAGLLNTFILTIISYVGHNNFSFKDRKEN